ncbi:MAG: CPBP family intramembrane metalloprotease [Deltaproteobacteria bacterium]|nr:CPBP family intramembrane metalloprotease [Deltaproteobacteria bacterium]
MALLAYIVFIFILVGIGPLFSTSGVTVYLSFAIPLAGMAAILFQKRFHHGKFTDMGFRLNRNALIGLGIGLLFTVAAIFVLVGLPYWLGLAQFSLNPASAGKGAEMSPFVTVILTLVIGGASLFAACLFGEELAFRGYILPKLEERYGSLPAIVLCSVIFALWHLPAYFSIYAGGAGASGWGSVGLMLVAHGISAVPISILYLTTRELYGVSLYHALLDVFQYSIIRSPELGAASKDAVYNMTTSHETVLTVMGWGWHIIAIFFMIGLCKIGKKWTLPMGIESGTEVKA